MAKRKKYTPLQKQYYKEYSRLKSNLKRIYKEAGIDKDIESLLPRRLEPSQVRTRSLESLKKKKASQLVPNSDRERIVEARRETKKNKQFAKEIQQAMERDRQAKEWEREERRVRNKLDYTKTQRQQKKEIEKYSKIVQKSSEYIPIGERAYDQFMQDISRFPKMAEPYLNSWLSSLEQELLAQEDANPKGTIGTMLARGISSGLVLTYEIAYDVDKLSTYVTEMMNYLPAPTVTSDFMSDLFDALEVIVEDLFAL